MSIESDMLRQLERRRTVAWLGAYRIAAATLALIDVFELWRYRFLFFQLSVDGWSAQAIVAPALLLVWFPVLILLACGYRTKVVAAIHFFLTMLFLSSPLFDRLAYTATHDQALRMHALFLFVLPVGRSLSVDAIRGAYHDASQGIIRATAPTAYEKFGPMFGLLIGLFYLDSALWKVFSPMWSAGLGLWTGATLPHLTVMPVPFTDNRLLMLSAGYLAIVFELLFLPLFCFPKMRQALTILGVLFHLSLVLFYPFTLFALAMATLYIPLLGVFSSSRKRDPAEVIEYSPAIPSDRFWINVLARCDISGNLRFQEMSAGPSARESLAWSYIQRGFDESSLGRWARLILRGPVRTAIENRLNSGAFVDGSTHSGEKRHPWECRIYLWIVLVWTIAFLLLAPRAIPKLGTSKVLMTVSKVIRYTIYPLTGIRERRVFDDSLFTTYGHQLTLIYEDGESTWVFPFYDTDGNYYSRSMVDRTWELWWKRTHAGYLPIEQTERNLTRWVEFFAHVRRTKTGSVRIRARRQHIFTDCWVPGVLAKNESASWRDIGRIERDGTKQWRVRWGTGRHYGPETQNHQVMACELWHSETSLGSESQGTN